MRACMRPNIAMTIIMSTHTEKNLLLNQQFISKNKNLLKRICNLKQAQFAYMK
jgi:hypothetical protein